jgi:hypothetical protein
MTTQRVHPAIGDPAEFLRRQLSFKKSCDYFDAHYFELLSRYPDQYVGIFDGEVRAHATDLIEVLAQLDSLNVPRGITYIEFLATNPRAEVF